VKLNEKKLLIIAAIVLVLMVVIGIYFYRRGKKQVTIAPIFNDTPNPGNNNTAGVSESEITQIAQQLFQDMDGFNILGHDIAPFQKLVSLSDTDFSKVYIAFNTMYQPQSGETLKQWIENESFAFNDVIDSIKLRFGRLNLL
jgi:hypothetical protein